MAGRRNKSGRARAPRELNDVQGAAERPRTWRQDKQSAEADESEEEHFDYHHEQLMTTTNTRLDGGDDDDDDDDDEGQEEEPEEDERHYLIGEGSAPANRLLASSAGKQSPALLGSGGGGGSTASDRLMEGRNLFGRLAGYLGAPFLSRHKSQQRHEDANLDDISTSDFAYEQQRHDPADRIHAHYYEAPGQHHPQPGFKRSHTPLHHLHNHHHHQNHRSHTRPLLMILLFLLLILGTLLLLSRLFSLVQDERGRLGLDSSSTASVRQDSVLSEISRKLDDAHQRQLEAERLSRWLVATSKCHIPVLDPWHESIRGYVRRKPPLNCTRLILDELEKAAREEKEVAGSEKRHKGPGKRNRQLRAKRETNIETLSYVAGNRLFLRPHAVSLGALDESSSQRTRGQGCCVRPIARAPESDDDLEPGEVCAPLLTQGAFPNASIVEVSCPAWNYTNVHSFVVHNQEEEAALQRVAREKLEPEQHYSVLMVGVDTISRLNGLRQLNRTLELLRDTYKTLEFVGYNKVGENTFPNLIPLLTGLKPAQLAEVQCWQTKNYTDESEHGDDYLDNCKYLWNYYQQVGYRTYFSEDWPAASTMNYLKPGFKSEPTTYYGRPFALARDKLLWPKFKSIGCASCQLDRPVVDVDLANLRAFVENNDNQLPYFAFHWINCPQHDDLNGASQVDLILERFFRDLHALVERDKTFVVFFSDHGYRWNDFVSTRIGHYESSLPLLTIAPPKHFIHHHPELYENLKSHRDALLTPFDLFKTFVALRDMGAKPASSRPAVTSKWHPGSSTPAPSHPEDRGSTDPSSKTTTTTESPTSDVTTTISEVKLQDGTTYAQRFTTLSLFEAHSREELDRSCIEAGIPDNYCVCQQFSPVSANRTDVLGAAYFLVYGHLEARLRDHLKLCRQLDLERVHHAEIYEAELSDKDQAKPTTPSPVEQSTTSTAGLPSEMERQVVVLDETSAAGQHKTTPGPPSGSPTIEPQVRNKHNYLPNREYSIIFSTKPGSGLYQEVVRFYGDDMARCQAEIERARKLIEDPWAQFEDRRDSVANMNSVCEFSVHSESLSRFNLYKDQSKCVTNNIELKKICYCNDLIH